MATSRRVLHRQNTLRKTASRLELLIDDIIETIEDTTSPKNLEPYKYVCNDIEVKRITLLLSIYHDWDNYIPDEIHTILSSYKNNLTLKNEFLSHLIRSYTKYTKYHEAIFSWQELKYKKQKIFHLIHNKDYGRTQQTQAKQKQKQKHAQISPARCGIYDFVTNHIHKYGAIQLLNDYHFILRHYYDESTANHTFESVYNYITERIGPCDISTCVYIKALYSIKSKKQKKLAIANKFTCKEIALMQLLNSIHCLIFHSFDIHRWRDTELDDIIVDDELEIDSNSLNKLHKIVCHKSNNNIVLKSEYFQTYPKYIATHDFHGIRSVASCNDEEEEEEEEEDDEDDFKDLNPDFELKEDTESTLDSLPNTELGLNRWSSMRSHQKMYKWRRSIQNRSVSLFDGFSRSLTPRIHRQNSGSSALFKLPFGKNKQSQTMQPQTSQQTKLVQKLNNKKYIKLQYLFGRKFCYWLYGKKNNDPFYVRPKHKTLKDEMVRRKLRITEWNIMYEKATQLMKCERSKTFSSNCAMLQKYKIHNEITLEHLLSLLIYCNVHKIRYDFKLSFHPLSPDDEDADANANANNEAVFIKKWVKRHRKWSNFARLLRESVECFGSPFGMKMNSQKVYYGIDTEIIFTQFKIGLIGPISTTSVLHFMFVCMNAMTSSNDGLILRLSNDKYPYCLNVNWLSSYSSENEYLFFGGNEFLNIHSIIHMSSAMNNINNINIWSDYFYYINSFKLLLDIINGKWSEQYYNKKTQRALETILQHGLGPKTNSNYDITQRREFHQYHFKHDSDSASDSDAATDSYDDNEDDDDDEKEVIQLPIYIRHCFERYFVEEIRSISIDLGIIDSCFGDIIRRYFVTHVHDADEIKFNNLVSMFPKTNCIRIIGRNEMKWNQHMLYKELLEFLQIDCYLNNHLREIIFEFPTFHYLVFYDEKAKSYPLKKELDKKVFRAELDKCGWKLLIKQEEESFIIRFYRQQDDDDEKREKREKFRKKNKKNHHKRAQSLQLTNSQSMNTKQLAHNKNSALYAFLKEDDDTSKHDGKPPIFNPAQSY